MLKLTCGVEFGMMTVSQWIDGYLTRYPRVSVDADFTGRVIDIVHEGFDLAIRVGELPDSRLAARRLGELYYGLFASPSYLARRGVPGTPEELSRHDLLVFTAGMHRAGWRLVKEDQIKRIDTPGRLRVNSHFAVRGAAAEGLGIAQLPPRTSRTRAVVRNPDRGLARLAPGSRSGSCAVPEPPLPHAESTRVCRPRCRSVLGCIIPVVAQPWRAVRRYQCSGYPRTNRAAQWHSGRGCGCSASFVQSRFAVRIIPLVNFEGRHSAMRRADYCSLASPAHLAFHILRHCSLDSTGA